MDVACQLWRARGRQGMFAIVQWLCSGFAAAIVQWLWLSRRRAITEGAQGNNAHELRLPSAPDWFNKEQVELIET